MHPALSAALALTPFLAPAQEVDSGEELAERLAAWLEPLDRAGYLSGTVLVALGDEVVFERAYGSAHVELDVPMGVGTRLGIASITKPITTALALRLLEEGSLELDATLAEFVPGFENGERITVEHLINHRAGIPHRVTEPQEETRPWSTVEVAARAAQAAPLCAPGERSIYSSAGFTVLAHVLERAAGAPYDELIARHVLGPAGMEHTAAADSRAVLPGRAASYVDTGRGVVNAPLQDLSFLTGAGSLYSTPRDLFRLARAIRSGRLGETVRANLAPSGTVSWNGATSGFRAFLDVSSGGEVTVAVCSNRVTGALDVLRRGLPRIARGETVDPAELPDFEPLEVDQEYLAAFVGDFSPRPGSTMRVRAGEGFLYVNSWTLVPTGPDEFHSPQDWACVEPDYDDEGRVTALRWGSMTMRRLADG